MKLPLHYKLAGHLTVEEAWAKLQLWHDAMSKRPKGNGFRQPIGTGSKRLKPRQGHGIKKHEGGCFAYLNGLQFVTTHGAAHEGPTSI